MNVTIDRLAPESPSSTAPSSASPSSASPPKCCPTCDKTLNADLACWNCCDRLCASCHKPTGSAFVAVCWSCWFRAEQQKSTQATAAS